VKKLAKKAEAQNSADNQQATTARKPGDDMNWFGVKLGAESTHGTTGGKSGTGGVGKYLNSKRPAQTVVSAEEHPKKRRLGFGDFENF
jgi:peptidyl-prolyl cis-trans isomerase-like 2